MKVIGIDDNSEAFSLLVTIIIGALLAIFTYLLHDRVIGKKNVQSAEVSVTLPSVLVYFLSFHFFFIPQNNQNTTILSGKQLFNGISKEAAKDLSKLN